MERKKKKKNQREYSALKPSMDDVERYMEFGNGIGGGVLPLPLLLLRF